MILCDSDYRTARRDTRQKQKEEMRGVRKQKGQKDTGHK